jgi:hypothetical protein
LKKCPVCDKLVAKRSITPCKILRVCVEQYYWKFEYLGKRIDFDEREEEHREKINKFQSGKKIVFLTS